MPIEQPDPFVLTASYEVRHYFRQMLDQGLLIQMRASQNPAAVVTTILDFDEANNSLVLDTSTHSHINEGLLTSNTVHFETSLNGVRIQFFTDALESTLYDNQHAFLLPLPESIRRVQRREAFRVAIPLNNAARCTLHFRHDANAHTFLLSDISATGMALIDSTQNTQFQTGMALSNCLLDLPDMGILTVNLLVKRVQEKTLENGNQTNHIGLQFVNLNNASRNLIQSYSLRVERLLNARARGYDS